MTWIVNVKIGGDMIIEDNPLMYKVIEYGGIPGFLLAKVLGVGIVIFWVEKRMSSIAKWIYLGGSIYIGTAVICGVIVYAIAFG
jgi:hypothetical protein